MGYLARECEERGASVLYATHIFDQADDWASHIAFMRLDKTLSYNELRAMDSYKEILSRSGADRAMCPMYVLVLEELERQYRESGLFGEDFDNLADAIMKDQQNELAEDRFGTQAENDQTSWVSGRLTNQFRREAEEKAREERRRIRLEREEKEAKGAIRIEKKEEEAMQM